MEIKSISPEEVERALKLLKARFNEGMASVQAEWTLARSIDADVRLEVKVYHHNAGWSDTRDSIVGATEALCGQSNHEKMLTEAKRLRAEADRLEAACKTLEAATPAVGEKMI